MFRRRRAGGCASPATRGTWTGPAALVVVPTVVVAVVVAVVVVGVGAGPVPVETFTVTLEPLSTSFPAGGFWPTTVPAGLSEGTFWRTGLRPTFVSACTASPCV